MREKIRNLVIKAITDTDKLTEIVDELCVLVDVRKTISWGKIISWWNNKQGFGDSENTRQFLCKKYNINWGEGVKLSDYQIEHIYRMEYSLLQTKKSKKT